MVSAADYLLGNALTDERGVKSLARRQDQVKDIVEMERYSSQSTVFLAYLPSWFLASVVDGE